MMNQDLIDKLEKLNTNSSPTNNEKFDKDGYLIVKDFIDPEKLKCDIPALSGQYVYYGDDESSYNYNHVESQVLGSISRYWYPKYREIHVEVGKKLEKILGVKLYKSFYYDRFYFPGQELKNHLDRDSCEISISIHVGTNLMGESKDWPFYIKSPDTYSDEKYSKVVELGKINSIILNPGDGVIYKGCERPHWRNKLEDPKSKNRLFSFFTKKRNKKYYYHQIFFHYVLSNGIRSHCAFDMGK